MCQHHAWQDRLWGKKKKVLTHLESGEDAGGHLQNSCQRVVCVKHGLLVLLQQAIRFSRHFIGPLQRTWGLYAWGNNMTISISTQAPGNWSFVSISPVACNAMKITRMWLESGTYEPFQLQTWQFWNEEERRLMQQRWQSPLHTQAKPESAQF